jgi:oligoendopeptidase F
LGYDDFYSYDLWSPLHDVKKHVSWQEAKQMILEAFSAFDQRFTDIAKLFFDNNWIDAPPAEGKDYIAYCTSATSSVHPYIFTNYQGTLDDVVTLAHELGHGIHNYLAREQGQFQYDAPNALSEVASIFCHLQLYKHLLKQETDPKVRLSLQMKQLKSTFLSVHVSAARTRFESALHNTYREHGELSIQQITNLYSEAMQALYGDAVTLTESFQMGWLFNTFYTRFPGYQYSYAFAELVVWSLFASYETNPDGFSDRYIEALRAGSSNYPHKILEPLGVDLSDTNFWKRGLELIDKMLIQLEKEVA